MNRTPPATVVIATYGRDDVLCDAIASVLAADELPFELLVIDQTQIHRPDVERRLRAIDDDRYHRYVVGPPSLPAARNFGIAAARGEIVIFVDDDVVVDPRFVEAHLDAHGPGVGAVAGRVRDLDGQPSGELFHIDRWGGNVGGWDWSAPGLTNTVRGCNMSFPRTVLRAVGGFDTRFRGNAYREESDVCRRVLDAGFTIRYTPDASLLHLAHESGGCRDGADPYDSPMLYQNEALYLSMLLRPHVLPLALALQLRRFVFTRSVLAQHRMATRLRTAVSGFWRGLTVAPHLPPIVARELDSP